MAPNDDLVAKEYEKGIGSPTMQNDEDRMKESTKAVEVDRRDQDIALHGKSHR